MTFPGKRAILEQLANGELATDEADRQLAALEERETGTPRSEPPVVNARPTTPADPDRSRSDAAPAIRARLSAAGLIEVLGDDTDEPRLEGPHSARIQRSDGAFDITGNIGPDALLIIPRTADLTLETNSSSARVTGLNGTLQGLFNVGHARVEGTFARGRSTIVANVGELDIHLLPGSNVHTTVNCAARIKADDSLRSAGRGQWAMGSGAAQLDISGTPGTIYLHG
jgi:hypothetical protein